MINGVLYTTAGTRRAVVALDAETGELLWTHRIDEGRRAELAPRKLSGRGLAYWTDGKGDERILYVTIGYRLVALDAKTGQPHRVVRQGRHRRSEGRASSTAPARRSTWRPAKSASTRRRPSPETS